MKLSEDERKCLVGTLSLLVLFVALVALMVVFSSCSTIKVNASQVDGTISVTSSPNQPVNVSVTTNLPHPDTATIPGIL